MSWVKSKRRARDLGLQWSGETGVHNAITDVKGVLVGFETLSSNAGTAVQTSDLPILTGVTAILPRGFDTTPKPVWAGMHSLNGNGEMTGSHWIKDGGYFVGPIMITNTHSVGVVHDAATSWMIENYHEVWANNHVWAMPAVAETYDGVLNDINGQHIQKYHALQAIAAAKSGPISEGNVGGGAGMMCYEFKGGTGTASRRLNVADESFTLGVLVQANHGIRPWLTVQGMPVGPLMTQTRIPGLSVERGSIICVIATDIPLLPSQLERLARRATIGIGRGGTPGGNNSGDIFLAFSTANEMELPQLSGPWKTLNSLNDELLDAVYLAAVEAVDEAVLNAMLAADTTVTVRPAGHICHAIDPDELVSILSQRK